MFAWTYSEMPGLDPTMATHHLTSEPDQRPVKHARRRMHPDHGAKVKAEVDKIITAKFLREV